MSANVKLSIRGRQFYEDQDPEVIELRTEGTMENLGGNRWSVSYEETKLTGLEGVTTTFLLEEGKVTLRRTGSLNSEMVFVEGVVHESLYQMEFGSLLMSVCANQVYYELSDNGGVIDVVYRIEIEQSSAGMIEYHIEIKRI